MADAHGLIHVGRDEVGDQARQLAFTPSSVDVGALTPDDFAQIDVLKGSE